MKSGKRSGHLTQPCCSLSSPPVFPEVSQGMWLLPVPRRNLPVVYQGAGPIPTLLLPSSHS